MLQSNPIKHVDCKGGCNAEQRRAGILTLLKEFCHDVLVMVGSLYFFCDMCSGVFQVFCNATKILSYPLFILYFEASGLLAVVLWLRSVPLRSLLKSCSLLISATSLFLSVCSRFSLLLLPCISVSYASEIRWISCSNWEEKRKRRREDGGGQEERKKGEQRWRRWKRGIFWLTYFTCQGGAGMLLQYIDIHMGTNTTACIQYTQCVCVCLCVGKILRRNSNPHHSLRD